MPTILIEKALIKLLSKSVFSLFEIQRLRYIICNTITSSFVRYKINLVHFHSIIIFTTTTTSSLNIYQAYHALPSHFKNNIKKVQLSNKKAAKLLGVNIKSAKSFNSLWTLKRSNCSYSK